MATDNNTSLSAKLTEKPYSVRLNADRLKRVSDFLQANNLDNLPDIGALFFYLIDNYGKNTDNDVNELRLELKTAIKSVNKAVNEYLPSFIEGDKPELFTLTLSNAADYIKSIKGDNDFLKRENNTLKAAFAELGKSPNTTTDEQSADNTEKNTQHTTNYTYTGLELLDDPQYPQLRWFKQFTDDKTKNIGDVLITYRRAAEAAIHGMMQNPLMLLDDNEYETLVKWDKETFVPQLAEMIGPEKLAEYGITNLADVLTGKHKFMMMWDFCLSDPAEKIRQLLPNLPDEVQGQLNDLSFPRPQIVLQCLDDIAVKIDTVNQPENDTTKLVEQTETTTENGTTADTPVIDIATRQPVDTASPETIKQS